MSEFTEEPKDESRSDSESEEEPEEEEQPVNIVPQVVERFEPDDPALKEYLMTHGFVVVKGVMNKTNIDSAKDKLWHFLDETAGMKREDQSTWTADRFEGVGMPNNGIMCTGIGQTDFMWYVRLLPRVKVPSAPCMTPLSCSAPWTAAISSCRGTRTPPPSR